jgi:hypothetical protein
MALEILLVQQLAQLGTLTLRRIATAFSKLQSESYVFTVLQEGVRSVAPSRLIKLVMHGMHNELTQSEGLVPATFK